MKREKKKFNYKGVSVNIFGLPDFSNKKEKVFKLQKRKYLNSFSSDLQERKIKNLLVIYDIPEVRKKERDWFRRQLINFDFVLIQKSVWVGPSPLSEDFLFYVKNLGLGENFKTFKLAKPYII